MVRLLVRRETLRWLVGVWFLELAVVAGIGGGCSNIVLFSWHSILDYFFYPLILYRMYVGFYLVLVTVFVVGLPMESDCDSAFLCNPILHSLLFVRSYLD